MYQDNINKIKLIEKSPHLMEQFYFKKTTSWIKVKDTIDSFFKDISISTLPKIRLLSLSGIILIICSIKNYFFNLFKRQERVLFVGSGSGLFENNSKVLDSYFPYKEIDAKNTIYLLSADYTERLINFKKYINENNIIIYSFLVSPFKFALGKILYTLNAGMPNKFNDVISFLEKKDLRVPKKAVVKTHLTFISGYILYYVFLLPFRIKRAYIVSAYSNSDICAVLKKRGIEIIEMQHGVIGDTHRGYNYAIRDKRLPVPDKIYVYNEFWKKELLDAGYFKPEEITMYGRLKYELVDSKNNLASKKFIVFTGQNDFYSKILNFFQQANPVLEEKNYLIYYIPHPNENEKELKELEEKLGDCNIKVITKKRYSTEQYIIESVGHISVFSSCHFDAVHYKKRTFVLDVMKNNPMDYYTKSSPEHFIKINSIEELLLKIG